ncbi:hypothetical protein AB1Y20_023083 [Prymnesium parvum]|uniref:Tudor domain-containing protein n=1 Tax=Prymnesium parvum TaxID=97485 RepID=A0AB34JCV5_PRYPA
MEIGEEDLLLERAAERANTAQTMFILMDSDADGLVAVEQESPLSCMLTSMLLSQEQQYEGDVDEFVLQISRHRSISHVTFCDFVDIYNSLVDRAKLQEAMASSHPASCGSGSSAGRAAESAYTPIVNARVQMVRRNSSGSAYLVSGAALKAVNGVYTQSGESDGVPKYSYSRFSLLRRSLGAGTRCWYICESAKVAASATEVSNLPARCYYCLRSTSGTPPLEVPWERAKDGLLPGPFLTPVSMTHTPPTSVLAPQHSFEVGDFVRANWAGRGVLYAGELLAINREDDTVDILYDDGDFESHVLRERVYPVSIELTDAFHAFGVGDVVRADLKGHGSWYTGRIIAIDTKFRVFTIKYENGHLEKHVPPSRVQPMSTGHIKSDYVRGERVRANWQSCGTWCLGRIAAVNHAEGTFNVQYDDGEIESHVAAHSLQPAEDAESKTGDSEPLPFACSLVSSKSMGGGQGVGLAANTSGRS